MSQRTCILHQTDISEGKLFENFKAFDKGTWQTVKAVQKQRESKASISSSKYMHICKNLHVHHGETDGYHVSCYKLFTAVSMKGAELCSQTQDMEITCMKPDLVFLRSKIQSSIPQSSTGVFPKRCIFCDNVTRRHKDKREFLGKCLTQYAENSIKRAAYAINDVEMLTKNGYIDLISKEVQYHHSCRKSY